MGLLFIDTETTGFPKKYGNLVQDGQARVCQVAMLLTDTSGRSMAEFSALIKPNGWIVGAEAGAVTGFDNETCEKWGIAGAGAYAFFLRMAGMANKIIAHNSEFDKKMMEIESAYINPTNPFPSVEWFCTMQASTDIINLPPTEKMVQAGMNKPKVPKLEEALQFLCGRSLGDTAHDAMYDVKACRDIYFELLKRGVINDSLR